MPAKDEQTSSGIRGLGLNYVTVLLYLFFKCFLVNEPSRTRLIKSVVIGCCQTKLTG